MYYIYIYVCVLALPFSIQDETGDVHGGAPKFPGRLLSCYAVGSRIVFMSFFSAVSSLHGQRHVGLPITMKQICLTSQFSHKCNKV